jgi:general secretion pathway protein D
VFVCLAAVALSAAKEPKVSDLYHQARKAERSGQIVRAYLLYSEAAALDPGCRQCRDRAGALQIRAALKAHAMPAMDSSGKATLEATDETKPNTKPPAGIATSISDEELAQIRRMRPPPELKALAGRKDLDLLGDAKTQFEQVADAFGFGVAFDSDYRAGPGRRLRLDRVNYREAVRAVEAATGSFAFPMGQHLIMVANDTARKRIELEPTIAVTIPIPDALSPQETQEVARDVQQALDLAKLAVDTGRRTVLIRDRISKVRPAQALFEQLAHSRAQVMIEMQFVEVDRSNLLSYGFLMPRQFPIPFIGAAGPASLQSDPMLSALAAALGAAIPLAKVANLNPVLFGLGIANAQLFATMNKSYSKTLLDSQVRSLDGATANFHVGSQYPILTGELLGGTTTSGGTSLPSVPSFSFEDLGLVMKVTPHVHGTEEVSLDVEAEFKVLSGQSANGIPVIATRKLESKVRLRDGEWALVAGLMSANDAKTITGFPGLSRIPALGEALRENDRNRSHTDVVLMLRPILLDPPPDPSATRRLWLGSETRQAIPL